jgi:hypothetical protein
METLIRRQALRHAAKVAFGSALIGCGGALAPTTTAKDAAADVATDVLEEVAADAGLACTGNPVGIDASVDEQTFECCAALVGPAVADAGNPWDDASAGDDIINASANLQNCCTVLVAYIDKNLNDQWQGGSAACCFALGYYSTQIACDPWGPPMPPCMA